MTEGVFFNMPESEYHSKEGLSCSGMKILRISPYHYWWFSPMNPARPEPEEDTSAKIWGKAFHKIMLEPDDFYNSYAPKFEAPEDAIKTVEDMKDFAVRNGIDLKGCKKKEDYIDKIKQHAPNAPFADNLRDEYELQHGGKTFLSKSEIEKLELMARMAKVSPKVQLALKEVVPEVSIFVRDPETGIMLKARMDGLKPKVTLDLKTFTNPQGKPIDDAMRAAIVNYVYNLQYVTYSYIREIATKKILSGEIKVPDDKLYLFKEPNAGFAFVFTESDEPHYTKIFDMHTSSADGSTTNCYYMNAWEGFRKYVNLYKANLDKYGTRAWCPENDYEILQDESVPNINYQLY